MSMCTVCLDTLKSPAALPCGHVFCNECIIRVIQLSKPYLMQQKCPVCRRSYAIANVDPALVPDHLRPHVFPAIRRLYIETATPSSSNTPSHDLSTVHAQTKAENLWLRQHCAAWRRRSEIHAAATVGLATLARTARDHALQLKGERDQLEVKYNELKRKLDEFESISTLSSPSLVLPSWDVSLTNSSARFSPSRFTSESLYDDSDADDEQDEKPSAKRRRSTPPSAVDVLTTPPNSFRQRHPRHAVASRHTASRLSS